MKLIRLPESAFWQLANATRLKEKGVGMAKAVLVDCRPPAEVAEEFEVPRQYVHQSIQTIENAAIDKGALPSGAWVRGEIEIPIELAEDLQAVLAAIGEERPGAIETTHKVLSKLKAQFKK